MTFPGGLLDASAVARLLAQMSGGANLPQGGMQPTPPWNPNANPVQAQMQGLLSQNLSQNPVQGAAPQGRSTSPGGDPQHEHRKGIRGGLLHAMGADRISPELASLLTPDQQKRVKPGLLRTLYGYAAEGRGPEGVARSRAAELLGLQDTKAKRDLTVQQKQMMGQVQDIASTMEPQAAAEFVGRMATTFQLPEFEAIAQSAERLRPPQSQQLRANAKLTVLGEDGNYYAIQQDPMGNEVPGSRVRVPKPTAGITYQKGVGPDGKEVYYALPTSEAGDSKNPIRPRETGVEVATPEKGDPQTIRLVENERSLAYNDAVQSWEGLVDAQGKIKDPPGHLDRLFTRSEKTNALATPEGQAYMNNVRKLIRSWVVLVEGKRMSDADARVNELQRSFSFGDKSLVVEGKKQTLQNMKASIEAIRKGAPAEAPKGTPTTINGKTFYIP